MIAAFKHHNQEPFCPFISKSTKKKKKEKTWETIRMIPSSTRAGAVSTWTRSVHEIHWLRLAPDPPHALIPTSRFRPPIFPVNVLMSKLPSSSSPLPALRNLRPRLLLPSGKTRSQMGRHKPVRLRQRRTGFPWRRQRRQNNRWTGSGSTLWAERNGVRFRPGLICNCSSFRNRWLQRWSLLRWVLRNNNGFWFRSCGLA